MALRVSTVLAEDTLPGMRNPDKFPQLFAEGRAAAARLIREYLEELGEDLSFQGVEDELAALPGEYVRPRGKLVVAWQEDDAVGVGAFRPTPFEGVCEIKRLYVAPRARGHRISQYILSCLLEDARNAGYRRAVLDTLDRLTAANALYAKFGFTEIESYNGNPLPGVRFFGRNLD